MTEVTWAVEGPEILAGEDVCRAVAAALVHGQRPGIELAVTFVSEEVLTRMHAEHLDDPSETDVITFDLGEEGQGPAGELYVSVDRARSVARERGVTAERELTLYVVHGVLHLCGLDDRKAADAARMRSAECAVMARLGFPEDAAPHEFGA